MATPPPPRRPPPPMKKRKSFVKVVDEKLVISRGRGALLGLAVGDAFGATFEGKRMPSPPFPEMCGGIYSEIVGGGPNALKAGQVTDDTQMATAMAMMLIEHQRYDLFETGKAYARLMPLAFDLDPISKAALTLLVEGRSPEYTGRRVWMETYPKPADNASLSRAAPIAVFYYKQQMQRIEAAMLDSAITHFDPRCQLACVILDAVVAACMGSSNEKPTHDEILKQIEADLSIAAAQLGRTYPESINAVQDAAEWLRADVQHAKDSDPELYGPEIHLIHHEKYVRTALRLGLWEMFHAPDFEQGLIDVINRGGDTDTNGAVAGVCLGALHGEGAIPARWADTVTLALNEVNGPIAQIYHPNNLLPLARPAG